MNRLCFTYNGRDNWQVDGEAIGGSLCFTGLPAAVAHTRKVTRAAETLIELRIDGFYACVHQAAGWPHRICAPDRVASYPNPRRPISRRQNPPGQLIFSTAR
jgi:hypothetical protein